MFALLSEHADILFCFLCQRWILHASKILRNGLLESCNMSIRLEYEIFCFCFFIYWHIFIYFYRFQVWLEGQIFLVLCFLFSHFFFMWNVVLLVSINLKCQNNLFWDCVACNKANLMIGWSLFTMYSVSSLNGVNLIIVNKSCEKSCVFKDIQF